MLATECRRTGCESRDIYLLRRCEKHFREDYSGRFLKAYVDGLDTRLGNDKRQNSGPGKMSGPTIGEIVRWLLANPLSTTAEVAEAFDMTTNQARYRLGKLRTGLLIEPVGKSGARKWRAMGA